MVKLGKAFLFVATVYTAYYVGTISGYVHGTIKEAQEESNGQGSGN